MYETKEKPRTGELYFALEQINNALGVTRNKCCWGFTHYPELTLLKNSYWIEIKDTETAFETKELAETLFNGNDFNYLKSSNQTTGIIKLMIHYGGIQFELTIHGFPYKQLPEVQNVD